MIGVSWVKGLLLSLAKKKGDSRRPELGIYVYSTGNSAQCYVAAWIQGEFGRGCCTALSHFIVQLCATPWTVACQPPLSMGFPRQEYWSGLPFPSSGDLPNPGIEPMSPMSPADSLPLAPTGSL